MKFNVSNPDTLPLKNLLKFRPGADNIGKGGMLMSDVYSVNIKECENYCEGMGTYAHPKMHRGPDVRNSNHTLLDPIFDSFRGAQFGFGSEKYSACGGVFSCNYYSNARFGVDYQKIFDSDNPLKKPVSLACKTGVEWKRWFGI